MELGANVWLRSKSSQWGWVPGRITRKENVENKHGLKMIKLTLRDDPHGDFEEDQGTDAMRGYVPTRPIFSSSSNSFRHSSLKAKVSNYFSNLEPFEVELTVDPEELKLADHDDIKLRNMPRDAALNEVGNDNRSITSSPGGLNECEVVGGVDDLIGLTHLNEPAILHALRVRYDSDIIYTCTGPILIAINPFKEMNLYTDVEMDKYRIQGEAGVASGASYEQTPGRFKRQPGRRARGGKLPPHAYQIADDAYRAMMRGMENQALAGGSARTVGLQPNQSILVSGESGAGKTVTTKIVLNYFAMLSKRRAAEFSSFRSPGKSHKTPSPSARLMSRTQPAPDVNMEDSFGEEDVSIEQQVLQSNPILESFGNARTLRNDNSSRFGKYIDISFNNSGKVSGASIQTYLLEKVRLIRPGENERNYHVFYQFLASATAKEREEFFLVNRDESDFILLSQSSTYDRRDGVSDELMHQEMLDAMITMGIAPETIQALMRLVVAVLFIGNMEFTPENHGDSCVLQRNHDSVSAAALLGVTYDDLSQALTTRFINAGVGKGYEQITKLLSLNEAMKAKEALMKAVYGAAFDYIVTKINDSIDEDHDLAAQASTSSRHFNMKNTNASIGVLDIFGFETFPTNSFEQLCINYTNEALQQQFNRFVFKIEQQEYEKEGILWKFITFPDNQIVLDLIDGKRKGILAVLDDQCFVPGGTDIKLTSNLYKNCSANSRFKVSAMQRAVYKFSIEHYAGPVEYTTTSWIEKNKDELPMAAANLITSSSFQLLLDIQPHIRGENRGGRGTIAFKSVGTQFAQQLRTLRDRIDRTVPHYIRCLKPNDDLEPDRFDPKNIVEQLRCGGVLEAVRVSRAGYPTRYPHDTFINRYYILAEREMKEAGSKAEALRLLVSSIAYQIWKEDHEIFTAMQEADKIREEASQRSPPRRGTSKKTLSGDSSVRSGRETPLMHKGDKINRPSSMDQFLTMDFAARCAVAGLQLGRTKVFIRREAFDRMESYRAARFFAAASKIQAVVRGRMIRSFYLELRACAIKIQSLFRMAIAIRRSKKTRRIQAAMKIQRTWRIIKNRRTFVDRVWDVYTRVRRATIVIQRAYMSYQFKKKFTMEKAKATANATILQTEYRAFTERKKFRTVLRGVIFLQALCRGNKARSEVDLASVISAKKIAKLTPIKEPVKAAQAKNEDTAPVVVSATPPQLDLSEECGELYGYIEQENWKMVENLLDNKPELAEIVEPTSGELPLHMIARHPGVWTLLVDMILVLYPKALIHRDKMGALPIHHAAAHDNVAALEIIYSAYKQGINDIDAQGRLPIHVSAEFDAVDAVKFLLGKAPEGAYTMVHRPPNNSGGGLPLHIACRNYASIGVITALLAENFASAKRSDENGDLPLHLILRCGDCDHVVVKTLLTCFSNAVSRTNMHGDLPLSIALKHGCKTAVLNLLLVQYPDAAGVLNGNGHSPLFLALQNGGDDRTVLGLLNHAPELATLVDKKTGKLPIQIATEQEFSPFIVFNLLKRDLPIELKEKVRAQLLPHHFSWNHIVTDTKDMYHMVVTKMLQQCTQPQVLALAHVEDREGTIALSTATPVCKHELRVMLRLFNTLEVVNQRPAYTNPASDTQIFYALRYDPPSQQSSSFSTIHEEKKGAGVTNDTVEDFDDASHYSSMSRNSHRSTMSSRSQYSIEDKLRRIQKEKGQQVIAKLTSRSEVVERELKIRKQFHLSRHYVPAIISVHHTVQHAAYAEAMAEPGYCITMEGADTTLENLLLDLRKSNEALTPKALKRIGISLLHLHEHGLVHCDFGTHNVGKFGNRWKMLGVGGSVSVGEQTDPYRGFYHPPESITVETKRSTLGKKTISADIISVTAVPGYDIWAFGLVAYEAIAGAPLSPYACRGKRPMTTTEVAKIGTWSENKLRKALKHVVHGDNELQDFLIRLLHYDARRRFHSMRDVIEHPLLQRESFRAKGSTEVDHVSSANGNTKSLSNYDLVSPSNISSLNASVMSSSNNSVARSTGTHRSVRTSKSRQSDIRPSERVRHSNGDIQNVSKTHSGSNVIALKNSISNVNGKLSDVTDVTAAKVKSASRKIRRSYSSSSRV